MSVTRVALTAMSVPSARLSLAPFEVPPYPPRPKPAPPAAPAKEVNLLIHLVVAANVPLVAIQAARAGACIVIFKPVERTRCVRRVWLQKREKVLCLRGYLRCRNHILWVWLA